MFLTLVYITTCGCRFERLFKLQGIIADPVIKAGLHTQLFDIVAQPAMTFATTEEKLYGEVIDLAESDDEDETTTTTDDELDSVEDDEEAHAEAHAEAHEESHAEGHAKSNEENTRSIIDLVVAQSGYVIIPCVHRPDEGDTWFAPLKEDITKLYGTNNMVNIFNGRGTSGKNDGKRFQMMFTKFDVRKKYPGVKKMPVSDPGILARVEGFVRPWFQRMEQKLKSLALIASPRMRGEYKLLVSKPGCAEQNLHYDFDPQIVQKLIKSNLLHGVPLSALCSFTPEGSTLVIQHPESGKVNQVRLDFGDMVVFTGDLVHAGAAYAKLNVRGFVHVTHEVLCPYEPDIVHFQLNPPTPTSAAPKSTPRKDTTPKGTPHKDTTPKSAKRKNTTPKSAKRKNSTHKSAKRKNKRRTLGARRSSRARKPVRTFDV